MYLFLVDAIPKEKPFNYKQKQFVVWAYCGKRACKIVRDSRPNEDFESVNAVGIMDLEDKGETICLETKIPY